MIRVDIRGDDFEGFAEEAFAELKPKMTRGVVAATLHLQGAIKRKLSRRGTGRTYRRRKVLHQASAPGEAPVVDSGRLRNSIAFTDPVWEGWSVSAEVGTNVEYAKLLEYGGRIPASVQNVRAHTRRTSKGTMSNVRAHTRDMPARRIAARPYMRPTVEEETPRIEKVLRDAVG